MTYDYYLSVERDVEDTPERPRAALAAFRTGNCSSLESPGWRGCHLGPRATVGSEAEPVIENGAMSSYTVKLYSEAIR